MPCYLVHVYWPDVAAKINYPGQRQVRLHTQVRFLLRNTGLVVVMISQMMCRPCWKGKCRASWEVHCRSMPLAAWLGSWSLFLNIGDVRHEWWLEDLKSGFILLLINIQSFFTFSPTTKLKPLVLCWMLSTMGRVPFSFSVVKKRKNISIEQLWTLPLKQYA